MSWLARFFLFLCTIAQAANGWHSFPGNDSNIFYTFQEFYTDAQYGPDFG